MKRRNYKSELLAGGSALALCLGLAMPAQAFDEVNWTWDATINEEISKNVDIDINLDPTGMVMLEDLQVLIGDVKAESHVHGIYNYQPAEGENGTVEIPVDLGEFTAAGEFQGNSFAVEGTHSGGDVELDPVLLSSSSAGGGGTAEFEATWDLGTILVEVPVPNGVGPFDAATELPEVVSAATAVGNNTSISTDTAVQLHEGQFVVGDPDYYDSYNNYLGLGAAALLGAHLAHEGVNSNLVGAAVLGTAALLGAVDTSNIEAKSVVHDILNASVDSSATAVANNLTVDVAATGGDRLVIGDVVQLAVADVKAKSYVGGVTLYNYSGLGTIDRPIVNSVATAVGNNKSITVRAPVIE